MDLKDMWTDITRRQYRRDKLKYASDLTDKEWEVLGPILPGPSSRGRPRRVDLRSVVEAIFYVLESGCQWRMVPDSFPPRSTVQRYFYTWCRDGTWKQINHFVLMRAREEIGREASPSAGVIDSQSVKTTEDESVRFFVYGFGSHASFMR
ncbi:MAG: IS5 family transposase [Clostridia bacterium]|nr:IS5 family transposase [Clostridia bacterium]